MVRAGVGLSQRPGLEAVEEAAAAALAGAGGADSALVFAALGEAPEPGELLDAVIGALGTECVVGASAHGVLGAGRELEGAPALAILAQTGLEAKAFLVPGLQEAGAGVGDEIRARLGGPARAEDLLVLLPDPRSLDPARVLEGVRHALGPARVVGAGAADPVSGRPRQWCGRATLSGGLAGMVLRGRRRPRVGVTQACRPVTDLLTVTRARGHWVLELEGRPALDVYREVARGPLAEDLRRAAAFLLVALPRDPRGPLRPGGYLVRHVVGFATGEGAFAIPEPAKPGQQLALALRDPASAREDLKAMLGDLGASSPALGLYFDCCARGAGFFGVSGLEAAYLESALGPVPLAGMFGSCEIGPVGGVTELLTYTGVLAVVEGD
jgi:small ligand-binding sensory domain FIST